VIGLANMPAPGAALFVLAIIVASGAAIGTQVGAAIMFVVGVFVVVEITLVSYLATPAKTEVVLRPLHDWALAHRRQVFGSPVSSVWSLNGGQRHGQHLSRWPAPSRASTPPGRQVRARRRSGSAASAPRAARIRCRAPSDRCHQRRLPVRQTSGKRRLKLEANRKITNAFRVGFFGSAKAPMTGITLVAVPRFGQMPRRVHDHAFLAPASRPRRDAISDSPGHY
jgi:hypothetical protein